MQQQINDLAGWIAYLAKVDIPVMRSTARALASLREDANRIDARGIAQIVTRDPLMTVKLLHYFQQRRSERQRDVIQVEQAVMMLGMEAFFASVRPEPLVEDMLRGNVDALASLLRVVRRAQRASRYAAEWAARLVDLRWEEVRIAALLHDFADLLMWCFAPDKMLAIRAAQRLDSTLRSRDIQQHTFGFTLLDLQRSLTREWALSELLLRLMDDDAAQLPRVRNVVLAVDLARHSADGWDNAALPDDYARIAELLRMRPDEVPLLVGAVPKGEAEG
jgi:HD-like signal output (HDOD) protein